RAATAAGYTLLVYDYFLTLSDEVECMWYAPWTPVKFVYLANRYIVLLGQTVICIQATGIVAAVAGVRPNSDAMRLASLSFLRRAAMVTQYSLRYIICSLSRLYTVCPLQLPGKVSVDGLQS
ncbi:hypothetical protein M404DRAFT_145802, partial [Pisolithus tinctorius Marx 270]